VDPGHHGGGVPRSGVAGPVAGVVSAGRPRALVAGPPRWPRVLAYLPVAPGVAWLALFFLCPFLVMVVMSFWQSDFMGVRMVWNLGNYERFFSSLMYPRLLLKSVRIALTVTAVTLAIAYPVAYWLARRLRRGKYFFVLLLVIPYWTSYVIRTYALYPLLGTDGLINRMLLFLGVIEEPVAALLFGEFAVHVGLIYVFLPFAVLPVYLSLERVQPALLEAAGDLGATPWSTFVKITAPLSLPGVLSAGLMVFILSVGAYVTPQILGGPSGIMFGNLIADQFGRSFNWALGGTLSLFLLAVVLSILWATRRHLQITKVFLED
jgi:spermidine/putrescine transport system permease protein